jgi:ankyrin repeat protein/serine/threonine protein kinase/ketosteroid isomerase-like protein
MAYVEVWKGGKLITRRAVSEERAQKGCRIRLGSGHVQIKTGETKTAGKFEVRMFAGDIPASGQEPTLSISAGAGTSEVKEESGYFPEIEGYKVTGRLGEGGMGTVWRAVQLSTHREVALKLLSERRFESKKSRLRFEREVELTARLSHPNIARLYDSGLYRGVYYYAMELIDGIPLDEYIRQNQLPRMEIVKLIYQVSEAVGYAHEQGIIHRDLKPSNILVSEDGQPHVLDFGLAKTIAVESEDVTVSIEGEIAGTPAYMAPEQAAGNIRKIGTRTDVYSIGVLLYYLLTGQFPYDMSGSKYEVLSRIIQDEVPSPRRIDPSIDRELEAILMTALSKEPNERYPSAVVLGMDIDNYLKDEPILAKMTGTAYYLVKKIKKHRIPVSVGVLVFLVILSIILIAYTKIIQSNTRIRTIRGELEMQKQAAEMAKSEADSFKTRWDDLEVTILSGRKEKDIRTAMLALKEEYLRMQKLLEGTAEEKAAIEAAAENYLNVFGKYKEDSFKTLKAAFSDSCISFDSDGRVFKGPEECTTHLMQTVESSVEKYDFDKTTNETATIQSSGKNGFMIGQLIFSGQAKDKSELVVAERWYMLTFQKIRNKWLIASEYCAPPEVIFTAQGSDAESFALHKAAYEGNLEAVKALIAKGVDVNAKWPKEIGATPLYLAVSKGDESFLRWFGEQVKDQVKKPDHPELYADIVSLLLDNGADINVKTSYAWTPLHLAAHLGHSDMAELLITKGADIEAKHAFGGTPLNIAALNNQKKIENLLIAKGAKVDIFAASAIGDIERVKTLMNSDPNIMINAAKNDFTPLHNAAYSGQTEMAKFLIEKGANVNAGYPEKPTPLYYSAYKGHLDTAELLINKGANVNAGYPQNQKITPLYGAAVGGHVDVAELLINKGADISNESFDFPHPLYGAIAGKHKEAVEFFITKIGGIDARDDRGSTPLFLAAQTDNKDMVEFLISKGAKVDIFSASAIGDIERVKVFLENDPNMINAKQGGFTPLHCAVYNGQVETAKFLLEKGADIEAEDNSDYTALMTAALKGNKDMAELLISKGANVNGGTYLPLYGAAKRGHKGIVELLIDKGAEVDGKDYRGYTALFTAAQWGWKDIAELLIAKGAEVNTKGGDGRTPLFQAAEKNRMELVKLLIAKGASVNTESYLPLHAAAESGNKEMVELLIAEGAEINTKDYRSCTALAAAALKDRKNIIELLIREGANVDAGDSMILWCAAIGGSKELAESLIAKGADVNVGGRKGESPLLVAVSYNQIDIVELLIAKGANVNTEDGLTPLFLAENKGYREIAELLRAKGADARIPDKMYLGAEGDGSFLFGQWNDREFLGLNPKPDLFFENSRWTAGDAGIRWPVTPKRKYRLQLICEVKPYIPGPKIFVNGQYITTIRETGWQFPDIIIPVGIIGDSNVAQVEIKSDTWVPAQKEPPSTDRRNLGVQVVMFSLTESSADTPAK